MKKLYFLILGGGKVKISYLLLAFLFATTTATAEVLLNENFDYEAETELSASTNWDLFGKVANTTTPIKIQSSNLTKTNYQETAVGGSVALGATNGGQDLQYQFSQPICYSAETGKTDVYYSALINISNAPTENPAHFLCFLYSLTNGTLEKGSGFTSPGEYARLFATQSSEGKYKLGVSRCNTTIAEANLELLYNETYLVVVKHKFVSGTTNDEVYLYINPAKESEPTEANVVYNGTSGTDIVESVADGKPARGIHGIELCQGQSASRNAATLTIDAIRVATTWDELFPGATPDPDPEPEPTKPAISAPAKIEFGSTYVLTGESYDVTVNIKGTDLEDDVTFVSTCDQVTLSAASATKEQVMSAEGFELTLTLKATGATCDPKLQIASTNATTVEVPITWTVLTTIDVADLAELRAKAATVNLEEGPVFRITNPVVVSYQDGDKYIYLQDDKGGIRMTDAYSALSTTTLPTGTKIAAGLLGTVSNNYGYEFIPYRDITIDGTATVNAVTATLAEIDADKAAYVDRLVRIEHVTFNNAGGTFGTAQETFSQDDKEAALRLFSSVTDIAGQTIPARATVVGISTSTSKLLIAPRGWSDITVESSTVAIDKATIATNCYTQAGMLIVENATTDIAVYNLTGICVAKAAAMPYASFTLPQGVYAVKMNGQTCKVVVK